MKGIESFLDHLALLALLESLFNQSIELTFEDHAWRKSILACCDRFSYPLHPEVKSIKLILNHVLSNDLEYAASKADLKDELGYYIKALYYQKNNDLKQALTHYRKGIAMSSNKIPFPCITLFFYSYMLALIQEDSVASRKRVTGFLRYQEMNHVDCHLFHILYVIGSGKDMKELHTKYEKKTVSGSSISALLKSILLTHYQITDRIDIAATKALIDNPDYLLLQIEASTTLEPFKDRFNAMPDSKTLLPAYTNRPYWQLVLEQVMQDAPSKTDTNEIKPASDSRIIYLVSRSGCITPKLQKSKGGKTWTKGRNIALTNFRSGLPEMTSIDHEMRAFVRDYEEYRGWGYPTVTQEISGEKALRTLVGHPLVFKADNPDLPVDIYIEEACLMVQKTKTGFKIETNVSAIGLSKLLTFEWETDTRIKLTSMTIRQQQILRMLTEISNFPKEAEGHLRELIGKLNTEITIHSDLLASSSDLKQITGDANVVIQLIPLGEGFKAELFVKPFGIEPPYCKAGVGTKSVLGTIDGQPAQALRDFALEKKNAEQAIDQLTKFEFVDYTIIQLNSVEEGLDFLNTVKDLDDTVKIEWPEGVKLRLKHRAMLGDLSLQLKSKINWFELEGEVKVDDTAIALADLLQQFKTPDQKFILLNEQDFVALSDEMRHVLQRLKSLSIPDKKKLRLSEFVAPGLTAIAEKGVVIKSDATYKKLVKRIDAASKLEVVVPQGLCAELRDYQHIGFKWMARLNSWGAGACLADDMGLGKTLQSIAMLLHKADQGPSLIVAPASVMANWVSEINRFAPALTVRQLNSESDRAAILEAASAFDIILTTYGLLVTEEELIGKKEWNMIVLDEAHTIKNKETKMSKAAMQLKGGFRLLLTGTPVQNHLSEIWNLFQFINPGLLGLFDHFQAKFITPIEQNKDVLQQKELRKLIAPFILRRTKNEVLQELPGKTEITISVPLDTEEMAHYELLRRKAELALQNGEINAIQTLAEITTLRRAASHIGLVNPQFVGESSKIKAFFTLFDAMHENHHRALVFSQFTSHLAFIRKSLDERGIDYLYLDGSTPIGQREKLVKAFQTGQQPLFLISLKAGGLGLNLTAADFIVHLDPWWNPAIEDQASDRAYRIGQTRPVTVYRFIAHQTIEEKIVKLHATKKDLADNLLEGTNLSHKLTREDILELLKDN